MIANEIAKWEAKRDSFPWWESESRRYCQQAITQLKRDAFKARSDERRTGTANAISAADPTSGHGEAA